MQTPVDPTTTSAWSDLSRTAESFYVDFRKWFEEDPERAKRFSREAADLYVDFSKNYLTDEVLEMLVRLAKEVQLEERRDAMFAGEIINTSEQRSVLHTALRRPKGDELMVDGVNVVDQVHETLERVYDFAEQVRSGSWVGVTGRQIKTIINIGIGGSDLGPVMVYEALKPYKLNDIE